MRRRLRALVQHAVDHCLLTVLAGALIVRGSWSLHPAHRPPAPPLEKP